MDKEDLGLILEGDTLELVRIQGIFLVASIAIFAFTSKGKIFSLVSLLISFAINVTLVINYYMERHRIAKLGFYPKRILEIIAVIMVIVAFFTLWIMYEVWKTEPASSLSKIAEDIETKIDISNKENLAQLNLNLQEIRENKKLFQEVAKLNGVPVEKFSDTSDRNRENIAKISSMVRKENLRGQSGLLQLQNAERDKTRTTDAVLAAIS